MDAAARFGHRNALDAVYSAFVLELAINPVPSDHRDDFLVPAHLRRVLFHDLHTPAASLCMAGVHAKQLCGEKRRLRSTRARTDFQQNVLFVVGIFGSQQQLELFLTRFRAPLERVQFLLSELAHFGIFLGIQQRLGFFDPA